MSYKADGFEIVSGLNPVLTDRINAVLCDALRRIGSESINGEINDLIIRREAEDHDLVYQASNFVGSSVAAYRLVEAIAGNVEAMTGLKNLHVMPVTVAIQLPSDERFDYRWHQETSFYPWADQVINVWIPLQPTRVGTGTMYVLPGSHTAGRRDAKQYFSFGSFRQIECDVEDQTSGVAMELDVGQYVVFDGNTVHRSDSNRGTAPRVVAIMRFIGADALKKLRPLYKALAYEE